MSSVLRLGLACAVMVAGATRTPAQSVTSRVSVSTTGGQGDAGSSAGTISADGRLVAFTSDASSLVPGDTNLVKDVFVHDRQSGRTVRVSVSSAGVQGNADVYASSISADGRYAVFWGAAFNLVPGDVNDASDVFVRDLQSGRTEMVSIGSSGVQGDSWSSGGSISADGRLVAFLSQAGNLVPGDTNGSADVFVHDRQGGGTVIVSLGSAGEPANLPSGSAVISAEGRHVAFQSSASNLVAGDTNGAADVFVHDRHSGRTARVSVGSSGQQGAGHSMGPSVSADGRYVAFHSLAANLVPGDTNGHMDVFVHDRRTGETLRASVGSSGAEGDAVSWFPSISADGRHVAFVSSAANLVPNDTNGEPDVFVHDRRDGRIVRASVGRADREGDSASSGPSLSADGRHVAFQSLASNLVANDTNERVDVFVRERDGVGDVAAYCTAKVNSQLCVPAVAWWGLPSASSPAPFTIEVRELVNNKSGLVFYGLARAAAPFQGGFLCVQPPVWRTALRDSGGNLPPDDCSGVHALEFNSLIQSGSDPALVAGAEIRAQYWGRDPGDFSGYGTSLSAGLEFLIRP